jgi:Protein FAM221A/B
MDNRVALASDAQKHVQAYLDYVAITGDSGDTLMSEKEFEEFKKNMQLNAKNRLYVNWVSPMGIECKAVGPSSKCFCDHRYKEHNTLLNSKSKVQGSCKGCKCPSFNYIPIYGSQDLKCGCKHSYLDHDKVSKKCQKCKCLGFTCSWSCTCGYKYIEHTTVFETREERIKKGKVIDELGGNVPLNMGGVVNFSSLADGVDRLENQKIKNMVQLGYDEKKMIKGNGEEKKLSNNIGEHLNISDELCALDLFNKPHRYGGLKGKGDVLAIKNKRY